MKNLFGGLLGPGKPAKKDPQAFRFENEISKGITQYCPDEQMNGSIMSLNDSKISMHTVVGTRQSEVVRPSA